MSAFPHLPLFTDAFIADTVHLNAQETGAYLMLMMVAWRSADCRLPDDDDRLARFARVDRRTWLRLKPTVMAFWALSEGFWSQKRLSKEREFVSKRAEVNRENGKRGGRPKSLEDNDATNPAGSSRVSETKAPIPIPTPIKKDNPQDPNGSSAPKGAEAPKATRIPDDFEHWPQAQETVLAEGYQEAEIEDVLGEFVDYWRPLPKGKAAMKSDWIATLRNRLRDLRKRRPRPRGGGPPSGGRSNPYHDVAREALEQAHGTGSDAQRGQLRLVG